MGMKDKYPYWKDALFGSEGFANFRCGVKYGIWHGLHVILASIIICAVLFARFLDTVARTRTAEVVSNKLRSEKTKTLIFKSTKGISILLIAFTSIWTIFFAITNPTEFGFILILTLTLCSTVFIISVIAKLIHIGIIRVISSYKSRVRKSERVPDLDKVSTKATGVAEISKETPVVRRVYGQCPVSIHIEPKWFDSLLDKLGIEI